jgi:peptide/nickel transport system ATP-binding protein
MYLGRIVEIGPSAAIYAAPRHPYTHALLSAVPRLKGGRAVFTPITGEVPSPLDPPRACVFHPRCPLTIERCRVERPLPRPSGSGRFVACHRAEEMSGAFGTRASPSGSA